MLLAHSTQKYMVLSMMLFLNLFMNLFVASLIALPWLDFIPILLNFAALRYNIFRIYLAINTFLGLYRKIPLQKYTEMRFMALEVL